MKKIVANKKLLILSGLAVILAAVALFFLLGGADLFYTGPKEVVDVGSPIFRSFTFGSASQQATTIVYGEVIDKSGVIIRDLSGGGHEYSTNFTVRVLDWIKGEPESETLVFHQLGGESRTKIYKVDGVTPAVVGNRYVIFLHQLGGLMTPAALVPVTDGSISATWPIFPKSDILPVPEGQTTVPVEDYLEAIRAVM